MKERDVLLAFVIIATLAFVSMWYFMTPSAMQIGGALHGNSDSDSISPLMAGLLLVWLFLVVTVLYMRRPH